MSTKSRIVRMKTQELASSNLQVAWTGPNTEDESWTVDPQGSSAYRVTFTNASPSMRIEAITKWDGCTDLYTTEDDGECYHHICDLDTWIAQLQALREKARAYFDGEFCVSGISDEERLQRITIFQQQEREARFHRIKQNKGEPPHD